MKKIVLAALAVLFTLPSVAAAEPCGGCWGMATTSGQPLNTGN